MPRHLQGHRVPEAREQLWLCCTTSMRDALVTSLSITEKNLLGTHNWVNKARKGDGQRRTMKKATAKF